MTHTTMTFQFTAEKASLSVFDPQVCKLRKKCGFSGLLVLRDLLKGKMQFKLNQQKLHTPLPHPLMDSMGTIHLLKFGS